jgi:hypothetical protein
LGLIKKIEILRDQIYFLPSQLIEIRGQIARTLKFWGQAEIFTLKNHFAKGTEL